MTRPNLISVDLGDAAHSALDALCKRVKKTQSEVIRDLIILGHQYDILTKVDKAVARITKTKPSPSGAKQPMTDAEREVIDEYKDIFNVEKQIYFPPALAAIRAACANHLTYEQIKEIIRVSPNDAFIASLMTRGNTPQLHVILSEKMVAQLWDMAQESLKEEASAHILDLEGRVKPEALVTLKEVLSPDQYSVAWDMVREAMTPSDVDHILKAAINFKWDEYIKKLEDEVSIIDAIGATLE